MLETRDSCRVKVVDEFETELCRVLVEEEPNTGCFRVVARSLTLEAAHFVAEKLTGGVWGRANYVSA